MIKKEAIATENNDLAFEHAVEIFTMVAKASTQSKYIKLSCLILACHLKGKKPSF